MSCMSSVHKVGWSWHTFAPKDKASNTGYPIMRAGHVRPIIVMWFAALQCGDHWSDECCSIADIAQSLMLLNKNLHAKLKVLITIYQPVCREPPTASNFHNMGFDTRYRSGYVMDHLCCFTRYLSRFEWCISFLSTQSYRTWALVFFSPLVKFPGPRLAGISKLFCFFYGTNSSRSYCEMSLRKMMKVQ